MAAANTERNVKWVAALNALMGLGVAASVVRFALEPALWAFQVVAGVAVAALAVATLVAAARGALARARWSATLAFVLGLAVIGAPFLLGAAGTGVAALNLVAGSVVAIGAGYNAWNATAAAGAAHGAAA